jgi:hypothetical protein
MVRPTKAGVRPVLPNGTVGLNTGRQIIVRTAGRIFAGLFLGAVLFFGFGGAANAQSPSPSPSPTPTTLRPTTTTTSTPGSGGTGGTTGGTTLPKTGTDLTVPLGIGSAALAIAVVLRRTLASR